MLKVNAVTGVSEPPQLTSTSELLKARSTLEAVDADRLRSDIDEIVDPSA